jgi:hypothetical protein
MMNHKTTRPITQLAASSATNAMNPGTMRERYDQRAPIKVVRIRPSKLVDCDAEADGRRNRDTKMNANESEVLLENQIFVRAPENTCQESS